MSVHERSQTRRWQPIDATRGAAMMLVCLSHFALTYFPQPGGPTLRSIFLLTRVATPAFFLVSGATLGWMLADAPHRFREIWLKLVDRGLFLVIAARPLIFLAHLPLAGGVRETVRWEFVTDTLAVCFVVVPILARRLRPAPRLAAAAALFAASWSATAWSPDSPWAAAAADVLVGGLPLRTMVYTFPVVEWVAVALAATALGERLLHLHRLGAGRPIRFAAGVSAVFLAVGMGGFLVHVRMGASAAASHPILFAMTQASEKLPPGAVYLLVNGGVALALLTAIAELERRGRLSALRALAALVGRNSLVAFVTQYFLYYTAVVLLRPEPSAAWPLWFALSVAIVVAVVAAWERAGGYAWLTVGLARASASPRAGAPAGDAAAPRGA